MKKRRMILMLLLLLSGFMFLSAWLEETGKELEQDILRLHVLANSDSAEDQNLKLTVRDRILEEAKSILVNTDNRTEAEFRLNRELEKIAYAGAETVASEGYNYPVTASIEKCWFPTKEYSDFKLPAGEYTALRIVIGEGGGQNWWCVVFPPLCLGGASEKVEVTAAMAGLSGEEIALITGEDGGYIVRFKLLEIWDEIKQKFK